MDGNLLLESPAATKSHAARMAQQLQAPCLIFLSGELGTGKTTWVRGLLSALGYRDTVKSPTYTLVESYDLECFPVCHFDLYRLASGSELRDIGIEEYLDEGSVALIEWAEKAAGWLPAADILLRFHYAGASARILEEINHRAI
ncbi:MAG: tRNA (adenosine(37)-N6)-threonylcarbamoyltransferase complex ATPase subunit type 1 TsaE [Candidatus Eutrophobiaceae bacterium]